MIEGRRVVMQCSNPVLMLIGIWKGIKKLKGQDFSSKNLLVSGYRKQIIPRPKIFSRE